MRFQPGIRYPHPPRGRGRKPYTMSEAALRQRCRNLSKGRLRSERESLIIKLLIWQSCFDGGPRPSQRALTRQLGTRPSYVCKVQRKAPTEGMDTLVRRGRHVTLDDLDGARRLTATLREQGLLPSTRRLYGVEARGEQGRLGGAVTADEIIIEQRTFAEEWKRKNSPRYDTPRRMSVPIPRRECAVGSLAHPARSNIGRVEAGTEAK